MRILMLGGTNFIGRTILDEAIAVGHEVAISHRGIHTPPDLPDVARIVCDRMALADHRAEVDAFGPEAIIDCVALSSASTQAVFDALPDPDLRWAVLSSMDVYRAFASVNTGEITDGAPIDETSAVRADRFPYPDNMPDYSKLDVEDIVLARGGVILRLPMTYGPRDYQRREEAVLRRVRAGRTRMPVGTGGVLLPRGFVVDVARGVLAAATAPASQVCGAIFNLCEQPCLPTGLWAREIATAAACVTGNAAIELIRVRDDLLPPDLGLLGSIAQPVVVASDKARRILGYVDTPAADAIATSVAWHLAHPPVAPEGAEGDVLLADMADFAADDAALAAMAALDPTAD